MAFATRPKQADDYVLGTHDEELIRLGLQHLGQTSFISFESGQVRPIAISPTASAWWIWREARRA